MKHFIIEKIQNKKRERKNKLAACDEEICEVWIQFMNGMFYEIYRAQIVKSLLLPQE